MAYWLMKSEPTVYSITDLERDGETLWDGVRNYQARNYLRQMVPGDLAFFYHSNSTPPGIVGLMTVAQTQVVDPSQFDPAGRYYDPKSTPETPRWSTVTVTHRATFAETLTLDTLRREFTPEELAVVRQGNRLSVLPVTPTAAGRILALAGYTP
ncbi:MAG: EVE domain-containing protein [Gloeomargaritaceae cyanobacterium C42_A2020_066]|nr:EVE domain-containing protein [Gloeomargaritaceae cyanobacterium C42_A2020_066]